MTTRNFDALFEPKAIALVGASNQPGSVGAVLARNLLTGGFAGPIMPVNPRENAIRSTVNYHSIAELPTTPDLAVIATPPATIPGIIAELGDRGCRAAVVITAGFGEGERAEGAELRTRMLAAARPHLMRILGPNSLGFISPGKGLNASFVHLAPRAGEIALISQSGAIATSLIDWAYGRGVGFSHVLSLGDMSDIDFGDCLDYLALDASTAAIIMYVESVSHARKFMSAGRIAARTKPVIVIKAGSSSAGARAATSHSGALAGSDAVFDAAFRRAGMLRVHELRELFDATETLSSGQRVAGDRLTIVTNGGGLGVLATDALEELGGRLSELKPETQAALDAILPPTWSHANPIDILGDANGSRYRRVLELLLKDRTGDALLVMNCPTGVADSVEAAKALLDVRQAEPRATVLGCWMGEETAAAPRRLLSANRLPNYETPDEAVRAFMHLVEFHRNQAAMLEIPTASAERPLAAKDAARAVLNAVLVEKRSVLTELEAKTILRAYGVPVVETFKVASPEDAAALARRTPGRLVLKILSRDITHKSDVGGVALNLEGADSVRTTAEAMLARVKATVPNARIDGFTLQAMIHRPHAQELIIGASVDQIFGPVLLFGQGGVAVEILRDRVMGLPPLNSVLALDMIKRTRVSKLLSGYRDRAPADVAAISRTLVAISDLLIECPEINELDINPLLADSVGVLALDARIVIKPLTARSTERLAIRPYPSELKQDLTLSDGKRVAMRPMRPEDASGLIELGRRTKLEHLRLRFHGSVSGISNQIAARLSQIDYDREMALVAIDPKDQTILGVGRLVFDPNFEAAEYAIIVRSDVHGRGLGRQLIRAILDHARATGASRVWGDVMAENNSMLDMARAMGAKLSIQPNSGGIVRTEFRL